NNPDILTISRQEDAGSIGIEDVQKLTEWNAKKSFSDGIKVAVIFDAHTLTTQAQNSILKVIEEPQLNTQIVLVASRLNSLLLTIRSRSLVSRDMDTTKDSDINQLAKDFLAADY